MARPGAPAELPFRPFDDVTVRAELPARRRSVCPDDDCSSRGSSAGDAQPALELLTTRAADAQTRAALELNLVVPAGTTVERVDQVHAHDDRPMDPQEPVGIEPFFECVDRLANEVRAL